MICVLCDMPVDHDSLALHMCTKCQRIVAAGEVAIAEEDCYDDSDGYTDMEADADTLASAGMGTDEDYGYFGGNDE